MEEAMRLTDNDTASQNGDVSIVFIVFRTFFLLVVSILIIGGNALSIVVTWRILGLADSTKVLIRPLGWYPDSPLHYHTSGMDSWPFGPVGCRISSLLAGVSLSMSIMCATLLNVDRYIAVTRPLRFPALCSKRCVVATVITCSCLLLTFLVNTFTFEIPVVYDRFSAVCSSPYGKWINELVVFGLWDVFPALMIVAIYFRLIQISHQHALFIKRHSPNTGNVSKKALQSFLTVMLLLAACWTPLLSSRVIAGALQTTVPNWLNFFNTWLATLNSFFNVLVYSFFNKSFRRTARQILKRKFYLRPASVQPVVN